MVYSYVGEHGEPVDCGGGTAIELLAALVVAFHACRALLSTLQRYDADRPRLIIADGVLAALGFSVAGTLLKALALQSWHQIGMFAFVLTLRTLLKQVFSERFVNCILFCQVFGGKLLAWDNQAKQSGRAGVL